MASLPEVSAPKKVSSSSSLLLSPPGNNFAFSSLENNTLLVHTEDSSTLDKDAVNDTTTTDRVTADMHSDDSGSQQGYVDLSNTTGTTIPNQSPDFSPEQVVYKPVQPHWFYSKKVEGKEVWVPFSLLDSVHLEEEYNKSKQGEQTVTVVSTDGGRYDVYLQDRVRIAIYWEEESTVVRRATWFYRRDGERTFVPYPEHFADKLEEEYYVAVSTNTWHRRLEFPKGEIVVIHNPGVIVHYQHSSSESWEGSPEGLVKPSVVKRCMDDYENVEDGETMQIDHLVFVVHGIGTFCDLKFRTLPEVVNDFRNISSSLLKSHFWSHVNEGKIGRVEFLPASWHTFLHGEATGIDEKLKPITLKSIPKLRYFANDAILDVLFYTSPFYCQAIINQVSSEINRLYALFLSRNPTFNGKVSFAGHSLGTVILFDLLLHQPESSTCNTPSDLPNLSPPINLNPPGDENCWKTEDGVNKNLSFDPKLSLEDVLKELSLSEYIQCLQNEKLDLNAIENRESADRLPEMAKADPSIECKPKIRRKQSEATINYIVGLAGTGHPYVIYPRINFEPTCFFALGSPIAMFLTVRGLDTDWSNFCFPNCPAFFNIFHPYDPVAYRIEPLIDPSTNLKPVLIPHHKGRKRMHLEIKESLSRVGADIKQKLYDSLRVTWNTIHDFARSHRSAVAQAEAEMNKATEYEPQGQAEDSDDDVQSTSDEIREDNVLLGNLNGGRRIDFVLQEKPIESFNEYLFALGSHTCYWESEDTVLLILKEIYSLYNVEPSGQCPEQIGRPASAFQQNFTNLPLSGTHQQGFTRNVWQPSSISSKGINEQIQPTSVPETSNINPTGLPVSFPPGSRLTDVNIGIKEQSMPQIKVGPPPLTGFVKQPAHQK